MSKIPGKVVVSQLMSHLYRHNLFSSFQSAYRPGHSTETAILKVAKYLLLAMDEGKLSVVVLLDLSAAFDTIDHDTLLHRLQHAFSIQGTLLSWFRSYLTKRFQIVSTQGTLILTKLSCVVVYLRALFYDPFCLFFIHNLSLVLFLNSFKHFT